MKYSVEKHVQILISLMKKHGVRKVIASPGMKNMPFIASVQFDPFFTVYSCVDERSAAYMAYGMALQSGEPVALSCTGATASRNYLSALTEAYYDNAPVLAVTSMSHTGKIGHLKPQMLDRSVQPRDTVKYSTEIGPINNPTDEWSVTIKINTALLELRRGNGGPVHINLISENFREFTNTLVQARKINRYTYEENLPKISESRVAIFVGAHNNFDENLTSLIDEFCEKYNGVVLCEKISNYYGKFRASPSVLNTQVQGRASILNVDLLIHIGNISSTSVRLVAKKVWRVNIDGEIRDTFNNLEAVFEMTEKYFFKYYCEKKDKGVSQNSYLKEWKNACSLLNPYQLELPFSNAWIASELENQLPVNSVLFLGILNTLRNWNFFELTSGVECHSNTGGFGIDGVLSTAIGSALACENKIHFVVLGDLAFFYDMNSLGNRHLPSNLRIILINNGRGIEFRNYRHPSSQFGEDADAYMAAAGHFGNQSTELVKHYAEDLGVEYMRASQKSEFRAVKERLLSREPSTRPLLLEVFTKTEDESKALEMISNLRHEVNAKQIAKKILGTKGKQTLKKIIGK